MTLDPRASINASGVGSVKRKGKKRFSHGYHPDQSNLSKQTNPADSWTTAQCGLSERFIAVQTAKVFCLVSRC